MCVFFFIFSLLFFCFLLVHTMYERCHQCQDLNPDELEGVDPSLANNHATYFFESQRRRGDDGTKVEGGEEEEGEDETETEYEQQLHRLDNLLVENGWDQYVQQHNAAAGASDDIQHSAAAAATAHVDDDGSMVVMPNGDRVRVNPYQFDDDEDDDDDDKEEADEGDSSNGGRSSSQDGAKRSNRSDRPAGFGKRHRATDN
jgi:hypothetical protein